MDEALLDEALLDEALLDEPLLGKAGGEGAFGGSGGKGGGSVMMSESAVERAGRSSVSVVSSGLPAVWESDDDGHGDQVEDEEFKAVLHRVSMCSAEDPVLGPFGSMLRCLGMVPDMWGSERYWALLAYRVLVFTLVSWSFIGWLIKFSYFLANTDMPLVIGWYEVSVSFNDSIPSAWFLCWTSMASWAWGLYYFSHHRNDIKSIFNQIFFTCPGARKDVEATAQTLARYAMCWSLLSGVLGYLVPVVIALNNQDKDENYFITEPAGWVLYDSVMTLLSFSSAFLSTSVVAAYFSVCCNVHRIQITACKRWLQRHEYTVTEVVRRHQAIVKSIRHTSNTWQHYAKMVPGAVALATFATLSNIFFRDDPNDKTTLAPRLGFVLILLIPVGCGIYKAASLSTDLDELVHVVNGLDPRDTPGESAFLNVYFATSAQSNLSGFTLFGFKLKKDVLLQFAYATGLVLSTAIQFHFAQTGEAPA